MPPKNPPTDPAAQLQWLVDRAAISDLLIDFARALDDKDWDGYAVNYADDGMLAISPIIAHAGRDGPAEFVAASLSQYAGTHHLSANHAITIDGDTATTRSYLVAAHVFSAEDPFRHADGAG
jgi:ketosteroid isomerase-like protein